MFLLWYQKEKMVDRYTEPYSYIYNFSVFELDGLFHCTISFDGVNHTTVFSWSKQRGVIEIREANNPMDALRYYRYNHYTSPGDTAYCGFYNPQNLFINFTYHDIDTGEYFKVYTDGTALKGAKWENVPYVWPMRANSAVDYWNNFYATPPGFRVPRRRSNGGGMEIIVTQPTYKRIVPQPDAPHRFYKIRYGGQNDLIAVYYFDGSTDHLIGEIPFEDTTLHTELPNNTQAPVKEIAPSVFNVKHDGEVEIITVTSPPSKPKTMSIFIDCPTKKYPDKDANGDPHPYVNTFHGNYIRVYTLRNDYYRDWGEQQDTWDPGNWFQDFGGFPTRILFFNDDLSRNHAERTFEMPNTVGTGITIYHGQAAEYNIKVYL